MPTIQLNCLQEAKNICTVRKDESLVCLLQLSLRGRRLKGMGKGVLDTRQMRGGARGGREGNACQETIVFLILYIDQANVKVLIG